MTTAVEETARHHRRYSIHYGELDFSDHGPMAALALKGLGATDRQILDYLDRYRGRLRAIDSAPADYRSWLKEYLDRLAHEDAASVLSEEIPRYLSGWARDAYHPLIRLAYGWEFGVTEEMAAGLAYLRYCGADEALEARAASMTAGTKTPAELFQSMAKVAVSDASSFDAGLRRVVENPGFEAALIPNCFDCLTRTALDVFADTHDFFALHLVTGSYAFRVLRHFAGPAAETLYTLGLLAGYAAIGAPRFKPWSPSPGSPAQKQSAVEAGSVNWLSLTGDDEHNIKIAYCAKQFTQLLQDDAFIKVTRGYLVSGR